MGKSFFHSLFFMEKRHNCLKVVAASHQFAPSLQKRRVRVTVTRLFHQDLAILSFALGSLPQGGGSKSALAKANRLFESSSKENTYAGRPGTIVIPLTVFWSTDSLSFSSASISWALEVMACST